MSYRRIAPEEAFATPAVLAETKRVLEGGSVEPGFAMMGASILGEDPGARAIPARLTDLGAGRIAQMDADGIDLALISMTSPGVQVFAPDVAVALAAEANDVLAEAVRAHPTRFAGLATVAPQVPGRVGAELERAKAPGLKGFLINSHTGGEYLDLPHYAPIWEAAEALDMALYLHPREPGPGMVSPFLDYGLYFAGWGFAAECGLHAMRLIMSGLFDRYPRLRICLGHMGEGIPFWLQRIDNRYALQVKIGAVTPPKRMPNDYFRDNFVITTSGVTTDAALRHVIDVLGVERVKFAGDYPYEDVREGIDFLDGAPISDEDRRAIYETNAVRSWGLPDARAVDPSAEPGAGRGRPGSLHRTGSPHRRGTRPRIQAGRGRFLQRRRAVTGGGPPLRYRGDKGLSQRRSDACGGAWPSRPHRPRGNRYAQPPPSACRSRRARSRFRGHQR